MSSYGKILRFVPLVILLCLFLGACGGDTPVVTDTQPAAPTQAPVVEAIPSDTVPAGEPLTTQPATAAVANNTSPAANTTAAPATSAPSNNTTVAAPSSTAVPTEPPTTELTLKGKSAAEIQELLFAADDPTTAGKILTIAGFEYDEEQEIYYSHLNPLQRMFGYNIIYDIAAPRTGMVYETKRIFFTYDDKDWMVQLWKGQYGITVGAEIGVYYKPSSRIMNHYDCVSDEDLIEMQFDLYKGGEYYFSRGPERHWWLTGFKLLDAAVPITLSMDIVITLDSIGMSNAFQRGLEDVTIKTYTYQRDGNVFKIKW